MDLVRLATHVPGLDEILGGGLPDAGIYLISGPPGSGKTVLAQQILYGNASSDRPALYLSTVFESIEKILTYVQPFDFFRRDYPGRVVSYLPLADALCDGGLSKAMEIIKAEVTERFPGFVVVDSFRALEDLARTPQEMLLFLYEMAGLLGNLRCVTLLLDESPASAMLASPVAAVADGIFHLDNTSAGRSDRRWFHVLKLRGSAYLQGTHHMTISRSGVRMQPRLGSVEPNFAYRRAEGMCSTGVAGFDASLGGGVPRGSLFLVSGGPGTGKTTFSLGFVLNGARIGESGVFVSFQENPVWLRWMAEFLGHDISAYEKGGRLSVICVPPVDVEVDRVGRLLWEEAERVRAARVAIDDICDLETASISADDFHSFVYTIGQGFRTAGITTVLTAGTSAREGGLESYPANHVSLGRVADEYAHLDYQLSGGHPVRRAQFIKTRSVVRGSSVIPFRIEPGTGIVTEPAGGC